jgi:mono/diheme cytochrome c family protein
MNRLLIESVEGRILTGIVMFFSIMVLIGWVWINEPSRMAEFEEQHLGRSIERGAELFASNCSECHGPNGLGVAGRAPALNNPHMFGYSYVAEVNGEIGRLQRNIQDIEERMTELRLEREDLLNELGAEDISDEREAEITERIGEINAQIAPPADATDTDAEATPEADSGDQDLPLIVQVENIRTELEPLLAEREALLSELQPAFINNYLPELEAHRELAEEEENPLELTNYIATDSSRLAQVEWGGDLRSYIVTTLVHGRPGSTDVWNGNAMAAWSQLAGGPLRQDQIEDLTSYILNWDQGTSWTTDDLFAVNQFARVKADAARIVTTDGEVDAASAPIGRDVEEALASLEGLTGDAARGEQLYNGNAQTGTQPPAVLGCSGCHTGGAVGPATVGTWSRTQNERLTEPEFSDYTVEEYLVESIVRPDAYVVEGYTEGAMLQVYGEQMTPQDMADVLAYLESEG